MFVVSNPANDENFKLSLGICDFHPVFHGLQDDEHYEHNTNFDKLMLSINEHIYGNDVLKLT